MSGARILCIGSRDPGFIGTVETAIESKDAPGLAWGVRFRPFELKKVMEAPLFVENKILDEELLLGYDNKLRYPDKICSGIYRSMIRFLRGRV